MCILLNFNDKLSSGGPACHHSQLRSGLSLTILVHSSSSSTLQQELLGAAAACLGALSLLAVAVRVWRRSMPCVCHTCCVDAVVTDGINEGRSTHELLISKSSRTSAA